MEHERRRIIRRILASLYLAGHGDLYDDLTKMTTNLAATQQGFYRRPTPSHACSDIAAQLDGNVVGKELHEISKNRL
jgi:hypothetical protein